MGRKDPRVDKFIAISAPFARPILGHIRKLVHQGCPGVEETIKWGMPAFEFKGILCMMAAFKQHAAMWFWKRKLVMPGTNARSALGQFGRLTSLRDLPSDRTLLGYIRKAAQLNSAGVKVPRERSGPSQKPAMTVPDFVAVALRKNERAKANFNKFSPSRKREYLEWLIEAKRPETRAKRLRTALKWIAAGKPRNWKYTRAKPPGRVPAAA